MSADPQMLIRGFESEQSAIGHLLVMAGPSCVGKSTLAARLLNDKLPELSNTIGLQRGQTYALVHAAEVKIGYQPPASAVLLHYELTRPKFLVHGHKADAALEILRRAERIDFLTLWEYPQAMQGRFRSKVVKALASDARHFDLRNASKTGRRFLLRRPYFTDPRRMWDLYCRWFDVCEQFENSSHWVLRPSSTSAKPLRFDPALRALPFWERPLSASETRHTGTQVIE